MYPHANKVKNNKQIILLMQFLICNLDIVPEYNSERNLYPTEDQETIINHMIQWESFKKCIL